MPNKREKHHIFSARTTEEGLRLLNGLKARLGVGWDELVIGAVSAYYSLDRDVLTLPKTAKPKVEAPKAVKPNKAEPKAKGKPKKAKKAKPKTAKHVEAEAVKV